MRDFIGSRIGDVCVRHLTGLPPLGKWGSAFKVAESAREHARELQRRDRLEEEIRHISDTDVLTGMLNRRAFYKQAEQSLKTAKRQGLPGVLLFADVDGLKNVNDEQGHETGDRLVQDCAWILRNSFRDSDVLARFGGDEFAAFTLDAAEPDVIPSRIKANVDRFCRQSPRPYRVSFCTGAVGCDPASEKGLSDYLGLADQGMYAHKHGRSLHRGMIQWGGSNRANQPDNRIG